MINEQSISVSASLKIKEKIAIFAILAILAVYLPTVIRYQPITGSLVNMSLILALFLLGPFEAVFLGLMPSVFALASGLLPSPMAPLAPFIMMSNAILIGIYHYFGKKNFGAAIVAAGFAKFLFLYTFVNLLISFLPDGKEMLGFAAMMGWIQFLTAVIGGVLAYIILFLLKKL